MIRVEKIISIKPYQLTCKFNDGVIKTIDVEKLLIAQKHLNGIDKLFQEDIFMKVHVGNFGEIVWDGIINTFHNDKILNWDYDISPEFAYSIS